MQKSRNTKQKQVVAQVIEEADRPLTVHEVLAEGQKHLPSLGLATVYREIGRLSEAEAVRIVSIPGDPPRYERPTHHHHHFKCTECDKVYELEGCSNDIKNLVPKGFNAKTHDLTFYGLCKTCS
jgi:Fur family ferric uptake transcriptional regulator